MMKFSYFVARNRVDTDSWLKSTGIDTFEQLVAFCEENQLSITPEECPSSLLSRPEPKSSLPEKPRSEKTAPAISSSSAPKAQSAGAEAQSQNLSDHGVYVDSNEAAKVEIDTIKRKKRVATKRRRPKNAKKV